MIRIDRGPEPADLAAVRAAELARVRALAALGPLQARHFGEHRPDNAQEERFLQGAACHGCLLIAEPSCERRNEYLDRALVVSTVAENEAELFCDTEG